MATALLPLKDLVQAKTRLSGLLRPSERRALAQAMAEDVLGVLADHRGVAQITLVSDDPGAALLANKYGADCWTESSLACRGLNPIIQRASERLLASREEPLLVLHCDLPLLTVDDISMALAAQRESGGLVIGCDRQGQGTNLLAFDASTMPVFSFGADSCARHMAGARSAGIPAQVLESPGIAVDVDEPADLQCVMQRLHASPRSHTAALLYETELGARIEFALATMQDRANAADDGLRGALN
jgi:2-phospho-L-lactate/phosphoenolpyruvate guanylyltransferase